MYKSSLDNGELLVSLCYKPALERLAVGIFECKNLNKLDVYAPPGKQFDNTYINGRCKRTHGVFVYCVSGILI